jgi:hypothetical protein
MNYKLIGDKELLARIQSLGRDGIPRLVKAANKEAIGVLVREIKNRAPVRSGLYRKSIGAITRRYSKALVEVVGARSGWGRWVISKLDDAARTYRSGMTRFGRRSAKVHRSLGASRRKPVYQDPIRYSHLLEYGHEVKFSKKGKVVTFAKAIPHMHPAFLASKGVMIALWLARARQWCASVGR